MGVSSQVAGNTVTIAIDGSFDISSYDAFNAAYKDHLSPSSVFVIDMARTSYMDSSALGMLLLLREKTGADQSRVQIVNVGDEVLKILEVAKFDQLFTIK